MRSSASGCVSPSKPSASIRPSGPITVSVGSSWSRPMSKSIGSCPGVTLTAPGPELRLDTGVGDDGHPPLDHGDDHLTADRVRVARVVGMHRHGRSRARIVDGRTVAIVSPPSPSANG